MRAPGSDESYLRIAGLTVGYGSTVVLRGLDLDICRGELVALLGASGCGKTTLLRALSGFIEVRGGRIEVDGRDITRLPPERRNMAMMFQSYALWPHMTVRQNVGYGLRLRGLPRAEVRERVDGVLAMLGLSDFAERMVDRMSGGQRQRVALGRALAVEPTILLLDEPLSNLDAKIRHQVRHDLKAIQQRLGITAVLVTHDREEAMILADRIVVLQDGGIAQAGTPEEVFCKPATAFVADFMGADNAIELTAEPRDGALVLRVPGASSEAVVAAVPGIGAGAVRALFRTQAARLCAGDAILPDGLVLPGVISQRTYPGGQFRYMVQSLGRTFLIDDAEARDVGAAVGVYLPASALHVFPAEGLPDDAVAASSPVSKECSSCASLA